MRIGDSVHHAPSGENWIVARVTQHHVYPAGWPCCCAKIEDCAVIEECSDDEHRRWVERCKRVPRDDPRHIAG